MLQKAAANLVTDGTFTNVTLNAGYTGPTLTANLFGQFGTETGSVLTVGGWTTAGYNFVYTPGTGDSGTNALGANAGYGTTYMWGANNGSTSQSGATPTSPVLPSKSPGGGNYVAADGIYEVGALSQTINGLTVGKIYSLTFYWAGAQQQSFTSATKESWTVTLGTGVHSTSTVSTVAEGFSGWMQTTMYFYATSTSETLSFLAVGTPGCEPPFCLLANVDLESVPDVSNWMIFTGFGAACIVFESLRRRRRRQGELASAV